MRNKVLIADDEPNIVVALEFALQKEGFVVAAAADGDEALAKAREFRPDVLLLDVMMPKKSGFEVCEELRADPDFADLVIVMVTAKGRDTEVARGLAIGADAYVTKPFANRDLLARIRELLERRP